MSTEKFSKECYRCRGVVKLTGEKFIEHPDLWTICQECARMLALEALYAGTVNPVVEL